MRVLTVLLLIALPVAGVAAGTEEYARLPGGSFRTALNYEDRKGDLHVAPFALMKQPVSNAQFLAFVNAQPQWRRGRVASVFADRRYLAHWAAPDALGAHAQPRQPVTQVSWFAAQAYCHAHGARLPSWSQWEYAAAADETRRDARGDRAWRQRILGWESRPSGRVLARAGLQAPNVYGVQDLHGLVWEWTEDFSSLLVTGDNRTQGDGDTSKFCGAGALAMTDSADYAVSMRISMLSSLEAADTSANLGFRCARNLP